MRTPVHAVSKFALAALIAGMSLTAQQPPRQDGYDQNYPGPNGAPSASPDQISAQDQGISPTQIDPEDRNHGVARVSLINGEVSVRRGDSGDAVAASVNAPLLVQDTLITGQASRAELQFDTANRVRFANDTEARISQLTSDRFQIQIARGTLTWAVLSDGSGQAEISTPSVAIRPLGRGDYRISVMPDGTSQITARSGILEVYTPRGVERVQQGQTMMARGAADNPEFQTTGAIARDDWDVFNERRNQELQSSQSYNYVSRDIAGAEELGNYGQWNNDPAYGQVWTPRVSQDWAPYRLGRWGYQDYYGWTWISSDPWGWAPYHYGSWFQGNYGWSWCPGPRYGHYYYRPALVAFVGFGGGGGIGFGGFGNVGWVPLAPFERYRPWYGRGGYGFGGGRGFVNNANVTNVYRNARVNNGITSVSSRDFASGNFGRNVSPSGQQIRQAGVVRGQIPFTPTNNHLRFSDRQSTVQPRANFAQTNFASRGQSGAGNFGRQSSPSSQSVGGYPTQNSGVNSNWNRFGSPSRGQQPVSQPSQNSNFGRRDYQGVNGSSPQPQNGNSSAWQRFGAPSSGRQSAPTSSGSGQTENGRQFSQGQGQGFGRSGSSPVQVAPPVVQQRGFSRPAAGYNQPNGSYGRSSSIDNRPSFPQQSAPRTQPAYNQPSYSQPRSNQPSQPAYRQPSYNQPSYNQPRSSQPNFSQPSRSQAPSQNSRPSQPRAESQPRQSSSSNNSGHDSGSHSHR